MSLPFLRVLVGELTLFSLFSISLFLIPQLKPRWLTFGGVRNRTLVGYCDVDWVSQPHCHSISGHFFQVGDRAVTWSLKKQQIIALSNTETEYVSLTHPRKEALWLWTLFREMWGMELTINCDNQGSITLTKDNKFHMKMKHWCVISFHLGMHRGWKTQSEVHPDSWQYSRHIYKGIASTKVWTFC